MNKIQLLTNSFLKLAQSATIDTKAFIKNLIKEIQSLDSGRQNIPKEYIINPERDKQHLYIKSLFQSYVLGDVVDMLSNFLMNTGAAYLTNPYQKDPRYLDNIYLGLNKTLDFYIKNVEKLKEEFKKPGHRSGYDESFDILTAQEKTNLANDMLNRVLKVLHEYADQEFPTERRVLERLDRDI